MAIQMRRGNLANYDEDKMLPGEFGVAIDEKELYIAFGTGDSKKILTEDDVMDVDDALSSTSENPVQNKVINTALNTKAPIASPAFTGTPTAPQAAAGTSSTQIATTSFVRQEINAIPSPVQKIWTGVCNTATSTKPKIVTLDNADGFSLTAGVTIAVYFANRNTTLSTTLNVNGTGAIPVLAAKYGSEQAAVSSVYASQWGVGIHFFTYDGIGWVKTNVDYTQFDYITTAKAPIASPTFTGTPKAPTAATGTNNTQIATTAFVQALVSASAKSLTATDQGSGVVALTLT